MKKILSILVYLVTGAVASFFMPWWVIAPLFAAIAFFTNLSHVASLAIGTLAGTTLWAGYATLLSTADGMKLAGMMGNVFQGLSHTQLISFAGFIGGLVGGMGALTGSHFKALFAKEVVNNG